MKYLVLAITFAAIFHPSDSLACWVVSPDPPQAFDRARAVFIGEVVKITKPLTSDSKAPLGDRFYRVTFKVDYSWKGAGFREVGMPELVVLSDQGASDSCLSWGSFNEGAKYLVYADETPDKNLMVHLGSRTVSLSAASEDLKELERMSHPLFKLPTKRALYMEPPLQFTR